MKTTIKISACLLLLAFYSCNGNKTTSTTTTNDSISTSVSADRALDSTIAGTNDSINMSMTEAANSNTNSESEAEKKSKKTTKTANTSRVAKMPEEPTSPTKLNITSTAFANNGVIPVKYTCDGEGVTPPLNFGTVPPGTKSYALIVHDYNAYADHGFTYWIIWNLDSVGFIPENFRSSHESMNAAKQYGYTPICSKSGDHKYHFIVYALDTRMILGKNTTKAMIESTMRNHILDKGELVGVYNKHLE
jgi:hypothetical protein